MDTSKAMSALEFLKENLLYVEEVIIQVKFYYRHAYQQSKYYVRSRDPVMIRVYGHMDMLLREIKEGRFARLEGNGYTFMFEIEIRDRFKQSMCSKQISIGSVIPICEFLPPIEFNDFLPRE